MDRVSVLSYAKSRWGICKCGHYEWQHCIEVMNDEGLPQYVGEGHGHCGGMTETHEYDDYGDEILVRCKCKMYTWVKSIPNPSPPIGVKN